MKKKISILTGPTASGKSSIALYLAKTHNCEIVSCDSAQIYKKMNIGTAKPSKAELLEVAHHMIDICEISDSYSVADYKRDASRVFDEVWNRGSRVLVTGGTGLYIDALIHDMEFLEEDKAIGKYYDKYLEEHGKQALYNLLYQRDIDAALSTHPNNTKRVARYLSLLHNFSGTLAEYQKARLRINPDLDFDIYVLDPDRPFLYEKINSRVDQMIKDGLIEEVEDIIKDESLIDTNAMQAIGYKEIVAYLKGQTSLEEAVDLLKQNTRNYAKRQVTWFKRYIKLEDSDRVKVKYIKRDEDTSLEDILKEISFD